MHGLARFIATLALLGVALVSAALGAGFFAAFAPAADSFAHFRAHLAGLLIIGGVVLALFSRKRRITGLSATVAGGAVLLFGLGPASPLRDAPATLAARSASTTLVSLSLNLNFLNASHAAVLAHIRREAPDVVFFQEVSRQNERILKALRPTYPHQALCPFAGVGGVAALSKHPAAAPADCVSGDGLVLLRVAAPGGALTIGSLHLFWPWPHRQDAQVKRLLPRLKRAERPVLLGGDFNAAPWSAVVRRIARAAGARVAPGWRTTWRPGVGVDWPAALGLPIDHVLAGGRLRATRARVGPDVGSDHLPVIVRYVDLR